MPTPGAAEAAAPLRAGVAFVPSRAQTNTFIQSLAQVNFRGAVNPKDIQRLLEEVRDGLLTPTQAAERLKRLPYEDLEFAKVDHHRGLRRGFPEVVYGAGKTPAQVAAIVGRIADGGQNVL